MRICTRRIRTCDKTHPHESHTSSTRVTWWCFIRMRYMYRSCRWWVSGGRGYKKSGKFARIHWCDTPHPHVSRDPFTCVTWLMQVVSERWERVRESDVFSGRICLLDTQVMAETLTPNSVIWLLIVCHDSWLCDMTPNCVTWLPYAWHVWCVGSACSIRRWFEGWLGHWLLDVWHDDFARQIWLLDDVCSILR